MRFLIAPNYARSYDQRMVEGLAAGFRAIGHEAHALASPLNEADVAGVCACFSADVLIQVNRFRPLLRPLPSSMRHVTWFQDVFPDTMEGIEDRIRPDDIIYALGDAEVLGLAQSLPCFVGSLLTGVGDVAGPGQPVAPERSIDFSLCGYIPPPNDPKPSVKRDLIWYLRDMITRLPLIGRSLPATLLSRRLLGASLPKEHVPYAVFAGLRSIVEAAYEPLRGNLDIYQLTAAMREFAAPFVLPKARASWGSRRSGRLGRTRLELLLAPYMGTSGTARSSIEAVINYFAREYPRMLDRRLLVRSALQVSDQLEIYGDGWQKHREFAPYFKGFLEQQRDLEDVYRRSRLNLMNNTHGLGLHSRTLECMAVGGFIFAHSSPHDDKPGGMNTSFEPDVHFGVFTPDTFHEQAKRWLSDDAGRRKAGAMAAEIVSQRHLWRHRAEQILADLAR